VLLVDDEPIVGHRLVPALTKIGCEVDYVGEPGLALGMIDETEYDIVVTDIRMGPIDGIQILDHVRAVRPRSKVVMITGYAMMTLARQAMQKGAFDFIAKPFKPEEIREVIRRAAEELGLGECLNRVDA
jgi:DNA-binding NtrC family response regulator